MSPARDARRQDGDTPAPAGMERARGGAAITSLEASDGATRLSADVAIIGGGACGLVLARALAGDGRDILVVESGGTTQDEAHEDLNRVEIAPGTWSDEEFAHRDSYHRNLTSHWDGSRQGFGVRCRGLGGSTQAWAGKAAPFGEIDLETRDWVPGSGWPIAHAELAPYLDRAEQVLNLGPGPYDGDLWARIAHDPPEPPIADAAFETIFWKFARSRRKQTDIMRFGADFATDVPPGVRVLTDATTTRILTDADGTAVEGVEARALGGASVTIRAARVILAASTIENARLLLVSRDADPRGLGNRHDQVGRNLVDHPTASIARFDADHAPEMAARFGLFGHRESGKVHVYMHGLGLRAEWQRAQGALNGAIFASEERADDDPFSAVKRLSKRASPSVLADVMSVARSPVRLARGAAARAIERGYLPAPVSRVAVETALRFFPNTVARDFQNGTLPVRLSGLKIEATTEQPPLPDNRVTLSDATDSLGVPRPRVTWTPGTDARANLLRMGQAFARAMSGTGLPPVRVADWVIDGAPDRAVAIDLGHAMGTTRMSERPQDGVVDPDCRVHGVAGLYAAGGSVMPTSGHANPTLTMIALALRLADHLREQMPNAAARK